MIEACLTVIYLCVVALLTLGVGDLFKMVIEDNPKGFEAIILWITLVIMLVVNSLLIGVGAILTGAYIQEAIQLYGNR